VYQLTIDHHAELLRAAARGRLAAQARAARREGAPRSRRILRAFFLAKHPMALSGAIELRPLETED
jgi:hypothetical protein